MGDSSSRKKTGVFKFTVDNDISYEAVIIAGKPFFLTYDSNKEESKLLDRFDQVTRTLVPPNEGVYPYNPIKFQTKQETDLFLKMFKEQKNITIDSLFLKTRNSISKFIIHHDHIIDYISALILFSYFQDKFPSALHNVCF
jgi:2-keto-4-pentenoate hydratase/2-oxohepta-3-ene-1,7-dioic acid hydratase in catechol pathway